MNDFSNGQGDQSSHNHTLTLVPLGPARGYGSTAYTQPPAPPLPTHFTTRIEEPDAPVFTWRAVIVSAIMCLLLAGTDTRLLGGVILEYMNWLAEEFLAWMIFILSNLVWSLVVASFAALLFPAFSFLVAIDWLIPGRPITFLMVNGQEVTAYVFYICVLLLLAITPPVLPVRWALHWVLALCDSEQEVAVSV